ncbi:TetR/AcrR family transcriptional regulator [Marivirga harenae]|uniref:TetR/AcrR family transcriptional regulator n=1 Tax=Marivirga harenae TaxID=2010992 RepID=UPI0026DF564C|nr:TetR/AcrR family transcriptional regulator [Marivirga harenae]WKV11011.1 TetR/AcrR family transcriptional regulator [Marivirga harenae]|tara:strand:- start:82721 stop:83341 length:621 start_codon:yes stop_codon:yes gene_type:complete
MSTKDKILETALKLFNTYGISAISSKAIADEMGISYGNLCYHFPKKDDIILQLYLNMQKNVEQQFQNIKEEVINLEFMLSRLKILFEEIYKYKFIYLGITKVVRHFDHIKKHAQDQFDQRWNILDTISSFLISNGYMKAFKDERQKDLLIHALLMVSNSWISDAEVFYKGKSDEKIDYYMQVFFNLVRPTLTEKGLEGFKKVYKLE